MDDNKTNQVASQTEIPVSELKNKAKTALLPFVVVAAFLVVILLGGYLLFTSRTKTSKIDPLYSAAQIAVNRGDYNQAQKLLREALAINKDDPKALSAMIRTIALAGNQTGKEKDALEEAKPYIDHAVNTALDDVDVIISVGYAYETAGEYQKALEYYSQATKVAPDSANAWFHRGHVLEFLNRNQEASQNYDKAYSLNPNHPLVLMVKGNRSFSQGNTQEAYELFKKAAEAPNLSLQIKSEALTGASLARGLNNNFKYIAEALDLSKQAVDASPNFSPALSAYGYNLYMTGKSDEGLRYLDKAIKANPRITRNYYLLALFARAEKRFIDSIQYHKQAISGVDNDNTLLSPGYKRLAKGKYIYEMAKTYSISGLNVDVIPLITQALELNSVIKPELKKDFEENGFFDTLAGNNDFLKIINSL